MRVKTIDCVGCGESVPYGRLSCPACGTLLASVSGGPRRVVRTDVATAEPAEAVTSGEADSPALATTEPDPESPALSTTEPDPDPPLAVLASEEPASESPELLEAELVTEPTLMALGPDEPELPPETVPGARPERTFTTLAPEPEALRESPSVGLWPAIADEPVPRLEPRPYRSAAATPGAYQPPSATLAVAGARQPDWPGVTSVGPGGGGTMTMARTFTAAVLRPGTISAARLAEIAGWFVVVGATLALLGFLLPWSTVVIGARGIGEYFDAWGLASPTHVLVVIGLLGVLALSVLQTPVPAWLATGVLGLVSGGLLVGLAWPYVVGPLGADVGVSVVALGGVALAAGGALGVWATRHVDDASGV